MFNYFSTLNEQLDYASAPIVYMPDEFDFYFDVEHLGRLAREFLIAHLPMEAQIWQTGPSMPAGRSPLTDLWLGGQDELLTKSERTRLQEAMREAWALPIRGKIFVLDDESLNGPAQRTGARSALREAGGILHPEVSPVCDYYVTDRRDIAAAAQRAGAKQVINRLTLLVMIEGPS